jgi:hypothetical protein
MVRITLRLVIATLLITVLGMSIILVPAIATANQSQSPDYPGCRSEIEQQTTAQAPDQPQAVALAQNAAEFQQALSGGGLLVPIGQNYGKFTLTYSNNQCT